MNDEEVLRRHFVAIATSDYDDPTWPRLEVSTEVDAMRAWLCSPGLGSRMFTTAHPQLANNPTKRQITEALEDPPQPWSDADAAVVFVTGHGHLSSTRTHYMIFKATDGSRLNATALPTATLLGWLADTGIQHLLVVLDACYSGGVAGDALRLNADLPAGWLVLPSATADQQAVAGALTAAITRFLKVLPTTAGIKYAGPRSRT